MVCNGIERDGFDLFHRLSPLILITVSLVLPSEQKELLVLLLRLIQSVEKEQTQQGTQPWGRFVIKATRETLLEFRSTILEGRFCDLEKSLQFLRTVLCDIALLRDGCSPPGYSLEWEPGAISSQHLISSCFFSSPDLMLKVLAHRARCKYWVNRTASSGLDVFCDMFVSWDVLDSSWWGEALRSPFRWQSVSQDDERRCCHANMLCTESTPVFAARPTARAIRAVVVNPYIRCESVGTGCWVAAHISSQWVPGLKPFDDVCDEDVVSKFMFSGIDLSTSTLLIDRPPDSDQFSTILSRMRGGTYFGEIVSQVAPGAVFPYTPFAFLSGFSVDGYFFLPMELIPRCGRVSFHSVFGPDVAAVYLKTHDNHWASLRLIDGCVSVRFRARHSALMVAAHRRRGAKQCDFSPSLLGMLDYHSEQE